MTPQLPTDEVVLISVNRVIALPSDPHRNFALRKIYYESRKVVQY